MQLASKFGDVREISAQDYVDEVNKAGKGVWVVLHLYKSGYPFCYNMKPFYSELREVNTRNLFGVLLLEKPIRCVISRNYMVNWSLSGVRGNIGLLLLALLHI